MARCIEKDRCKPRMLAPTRSVRAARNPGGAARHASSRRYPGVGEKPQNAKQGWTMGTQRGTDTVTDTDADTRQKHKTETQTETETQRETQTQASTQTHTMLCHAYQTSVRRKHKHKSTHDKYTFRVRPRAREKQWKPNRFLRVKRRGTQTGLPPPPTLALGHPRCKTRHASAVFWVSNPVDRWGTQTGPSPPPTLALGHPRCKTRNATARCQQSSLRHVP